MARDKGDPKTLADIADYLSQHKYRVPTVHLDEYEIGADALKLVGLEQCETHTVIPVAVVSGSLIVAMVDPANLVALEALKLSTGYNIEPVIASEAEIRSAIAKYCRPSRHLN